MRVSLVGLVLAGPLLIANAQAGEADAVKRELKKLQGTWKVVAFTAGGKDVPVDKGGFARLVIKGTRITLTGGPKDVALSFTIDPGKKPKTMDLLITTGDQSVNWKCIYALKGDELKICMPLAPKKGSKVPVKEDPNQRPSTFDTEGRPMMLIQAKRTAADE
jgi:uncharacterized protein (TIGR03067 family)